MFCCVLFLTLRFLRTLQKKLVKRDKQWHFPFDPSAFSTFPERIFTK